MTATSWQAQAACRGVDVNVFHPTVGGAITLALKYCTPCPVRAECLAYAIAEEIEAGVWGGMTPRDRLAIIRKQGRKPKPIAHGTVRGYFQHRRAGEVACDECREAKARDASAYQRERRARLRQLKVTAA